MYYFGIIFITDGTGISLTHHYADDVNYYDATINNGDNINPLERFYLISEKKWHKDTVVPISLLPSTEGMPARSHHRYNIRYATNNLILTLFSKILKFVLYPETFSMQDPAVHDGTG